MELNLRKSSPSSIEADVLVLGVFQDESIEDVLKTIDPELADDWLNEIVHLCKAESFKAKNKESISFFGSGKIAARRLILFGLGKTAECDASRIRKTSANLARQFASKEGYKHVVLQLRLDGRSDLLQAAVEGWLLGSYSFHFYKNPSEEENVATIKTEKITFVDGTINETDFAKACRQGRVIGECTNFARDLIAQPACDMTPSKLAESAQSLAVSKGSVTCEILDVEAILELGMGAYLGVAKGSHEPLKFINLKYNHKNSKKFIVLIGKGITFDSGGLSLKTASGMETMKQDMAGAAAVLGVLKAMSELEVPITVQVIVAACENMPGGGALRPGDILRAMNGKTIEVNNTDAEGRLTLADALTYACRLKPDAIVDIATLTGAVVTALGRAAAGIMGNEQALVSRIMESGERSGEKFWQLPLFDEYKEALKSDVADFKNAGSRGEAATSCAGMFLKEFVNGAPWAHLDIAGVGWLDKEKEELNKGGVAFGVRALSYFLLSEADQRNVSNS